MGPDTADGCANVPFQGSKFFYKTNGTELYVVYFAPALRITVTVLIRILGQLHQGNRIPT